MKRRACILPLSGLTNEIVDLLDYRYVQKNKCTKTMKCSLVLSYLVSRIQIKLNDLMDPLVCYPSGSLADNNERLLKNIATIWSVDMDEVETHIKNISAFEHILDSVVLDPDRNSFDTWVISCRDPEWVVECLGDYRILEWASEHIHNGEYVPGNGIKVQNEQEDFYDANNFILTEML
jgi:hypothetical protein